MLLVFGRSNHRALETQIDLSIPIIMTRASSQNSTRLIPYRRKYDRLREQALSESMGTQDVLEVFGEYEYVKLLWLPGGSYTADESKNKLPTIFREATQDDRRLVKTMLECSNVINTAWFQDLRTAAQTVTHAP